MVTLANRDEPLLVLDATLRAIVRHAEGKADLKTAYLEATGLCNGKSVLPPAFLLELVAILELGLYHVSLAAFCAVEVPPV